MSFKVSDRLAARRQSSLEAIFSVGSFSAGEQMGYGPMEQIASAIIRQHPAAEGNGGHFNYLICIIFQQAMSEKL